MIAGIFHSGSGLGNQLFRYVATRVLALDNGYDFSMVAPENFKGRDFMNLDMGKDDNYFGGKTMLPFHYTTKMPEGRVIPHAGYNFWYKTWEEKTPYYNPEFNFIEDNTIIDGEFQDERYFGHHLDKIDGWLGVARNQVEDDICVIGFRGGEFYTVPELGLPKSYYDEGIARMRKINPNMKFEVHTDDPALAKQFFPDFEVIHDIGYNWRRVRFARYAIIANSSFYILPRLLKHSGDRWGYDGDEPITLAPRYWDRYNIKKWERPYNYYKNFTYI